MNSIRTSKGSSIEIIPLGAGQDVGRSCILVKIGGKRIMLDCGMHMGYNDDRRFPDFSFINPDGTGLDDFLDCAIISHFHLDHCGALPYMTEIVGFEGPVFMTSPTKAVCPILLEDYRKITVDRKGETNFFTSEHIKVCMRDKVKTVRLHEVVAVDQELTIKAFYAGHVLGAAMFLIRVGDESVWYTGDYNMTADRHLGPAQVERASPTVLITESTYATITRDSKRCRERDFATKVHRCVEDKKGKVLIPVFALGRAQELCILLESYWERVGLTVPIFFSGGLTEKSNFYYQLFITWTSEKIRKTFVDRNMFHFRHIKPFDRSLIDSPGPMVVFATPGMLHAGLSLAIFKKWASDPRNLIVIPGYCVAGTIGHKILHGAKVLEWDHPKQSIPVNLDVQYMSFSAHADSKGICQLIRQLSPQNVVLVHGEKENMKRLQGKIANEIGLPCFFPSNGELLTISIPPRIPVRLAPDLIPPNYLARAGEKHMVDAVLVQEASGGDGGVGGKTLLVSEEGFLKSIGAKRHKVKFSANFELAPTAFITLSQVSNVIQERFPQIRVICHSEQHRLFVDEDVLVTIPQGGRVTKDDDEVYVYWNLDKDDLGNFIFGLLRKTWARGNYQSSTGHC